MTLLIFLETDRRDKDETQLTCAAVGCASSPGVAVSPLLVRLDIADDLPVSSDSKDRLQTTPARNILHLDHKRSQIQIRNTDTI